MEELRAAALPFQADPARETLLGQDLASVDVVLLGEDTHGTREFYELRSRLTQYLIAEHGFTAVLIEGDWPEASPVNAYVRGEEAGPDPLAGFASFPNWMWRNEEVRGLMEWMRDLNLGELVRTQWDRSTFLLGFTTYEGAVTAASSWGGAPEDKPLAPAVEGSYEHLFHQLGLPRFVVRLRGDAPEVLRQTRPERAVGVVFQPSQERVGNYLDARMAEQFDAVIHVDRSTRVLPLGR
ncbi:MAG TPA: erythromycin esterase family protein [Myxococcaceae bacterium]|nr:erythromycin esterase family protein [Myxococcaceae bacterium]